MPTELRTCIPAWLRKIYCMHEETITIQKQNSHKSNQLSKLRPKLARRSTVLLRQCGKVKISVAFSLRPKMIAMTTTTVIIMQAYASTTSPLITEIEKETLHCRCQYQQAKKLQAHRQLSKTVPKTPKAQPGHAICRLMIFDSLKPQNFDTLSVVYQWQITADMTNVAILQL